MMRDGKLMIIGKGFEKFLRKLGIEFVEGDPPIEWVAIPFKEARLCLDCNNIVRNVKCPVCGSKYHLILPVVLDGRSMKRKWKMKNENKKISRADDSASTRDEGKTS